jgi:zinc finger SWIM domain-containing protein 3
MTTDDGVVKGIFFQDEGMKKFFGQYPELLMMDATYKLTNVRMPVYVMLCVGPLGESEIVAVFLTDSEDTASLTEAMQCFKQRNSNWTKIRTVITDKDMAEREAIKQEFTDATLLLCLFHVLRAMSREITTSKMHVTRA